MPTHLSLLLRKPWYYARVIAVCAPPSYALWYGDRKWVRCLADLKLETVCVYHQD